MGVFKKTFLELIVLVVILLLVALVFNAFVDEEDTVNKIQGSINEQILDLEIADNSFLQAQGLSGRAFLGENEGMLFVYPQEVIDLRFWMKNMLIPLDFIFLNGELVIVDIIENVPICDVDPCPVYSSQESVQYVLEVNAGWVAKNGVVLGDKLLIKE